MSWAEEQSWFGLEPEDLEWLENVHQNNIKQLFLTKGIWTTKTNNHIHIFCLVETPSFSVERKQDLFLFC